MNRQFKLDHAWLHFKCLGRMLYERIVEGKHKHDLMCHITFSVKGIFRSIGVTH